jgi:hypothetical protein
MRIDSASLTALTGRAVPARSEAHTPGHSGVHRVLQRSYWHAARCHVDSRAPLVSWSSRMVILLASALGSP